ncbi:MAG: DUF1853 family protein [Verrucomicrobiota bacterium]
MESLREAPLFAVDLPEAPVMDRQQFGAFLPSYSLNFNQKLGHLYEDALEHLLQDSGQMVDAHLQVVDSAGVTVGEMDFLLLDALDNCHIHLELAVKFYLAHCSTDGWQYPGPDARDNWLRKLQRLRTHQLRLSKHLASSDFLEKRYGIDHLRVRQLVYGRLFGPIAEPDYPLPEAVSEDVLRGRWLYRHQWNEYMSMDQEIHVIPKPLWPVLLTAELVETLPCIPVADLHQLAETRCTMFFADDSLEPYFLVPDAWPDV